VLIYEMLASSPPFYDEDPMKTYQKIMRGKVSYPSHFSKRAVNIITALLNIKPTKRLGVIEGGAAKIKSHAWFAGFDWKRLYEKKMVAPIIPKIKSPEDISNFDDAPAEPEVAPYVDDGTEWEKDF